MMMEIMTCPTSGLDGLYFPYNIAESRYSMDSFRPEYSGGRITEQDCCNLLKEIHDCPLSKDVWDHGLWFLVLGFVVMAACLSVYVVLFVSDKFDRTSFNVGLILILILGIATLITNVVVLGKRSSSRMAVGKIVFDSILKRYNNNVLEPKQAIAKMSNSKGFIYIQFLWFAKQPQPVNHMMPF